MEGGSFWRHGFDLGGDWVLGGGSEVLFHSPGEWRLYKFGGVRVFCILTTFDVPHDSSFIETPFRNSLVWRTENLLVMRGRGRIGWSERV